jgi:hypothetical protein
LNFHREALRLREEQHARHPSNLLAVRNYQGSLTRVGEILLAAKQYRSAESKFDLALAVGNDLTKQVASDVYMSADLAKRSAATATRRPRHRFGNPSRYGVTPANARHWTRG